MKDKIVSCVCEIFPKNFGSFNVMNKRIRRGEYDMTNATPIAMNVVNPFIYGFFDHAFRKETKKLLCHGK
jgi:hypothetical protein